MPPSSVSPAPTGPEKRRLGLLLADILCLHHGNICRFYSTDQGFNLPEAAVFEEELELLVQLSPAQRKTINAAVKAYSKTHDVSSFGGNQPADRICRELEQTQTQENAETLKNMLEAQGIECAVRPGKHPRLPSLHLVIDGAQAGFPRNLQMLQEAAGESFLARTNHLPNDLEEWAQARIPKRADDAALPLSPDQAAGALAGWVRQLSALARNLRVEKQLQASLNAPAATTPGRAKAPQNAEEST